MCVRVKKWREDAQPEFRSDTQPEGRSDVGTRWVEAVAESQAVSGVGGSGFGSPGPVPRQRAVAAPARGEESGISFGAPYRRRWENPVEAGHTHDPHEVTVQLDGAGRQLDEPLARQAKDAQDAGAGGDGPVFVDETGRRSRRYRRIGMVVGVSCAVYAVVIVATLLSGNSDAPWLPVPGQQDEQPAGQVETDPLPAESVKPSDPAGATPVAPGASVSAGVTPSKGAAAVKPGASPSVARPGTSVAPVPSAGAVKPEPGTPTTPGPQPEPSATMSSPPPEPSPSQSGLPSPDPSPSPSPSTSPTTDGGTVAGGRTDPTPIAESPAEPSATLAAGDPASAPTPATVTA
ncbi:hypothetical protein ADL01_10345 [Streptomyces sp. NRRL WC-3618]|nr:hypothetical protein ADL01_10345 [Streptomyces sp. NRRL WC-3618]